MRKSQVSILGTIGFESFGAAHVESKCVFGLKLGGTKRAFEQKLLLNMY